MYKTHLDFALKLSVNADLISSLYTWDNADVIQNPVQLNSLQCHLTHSSRLAFRHRFSPKSPHHPCLFRLNYYCYYDYYDSDSTLIC